ncbi:MAG: T9SS type A sorting domain-containing protein [Bacteroidetes bacterium]|nr:MAG: T9SS type A sorting domain-containing protein [Bacteroidota bacterium]
MKKTLLITSVLSVFGFNAFAQNVNIPDANFKAYLVGNAAINTNADAEIQMSEAVAFTDVIYCPNMGISDLTGIEAFINTKGIYCELNNLTSLDVSANVNITKLVCNNNQLTSLDVSSNTNLQYLTAANNQLTGLDLTSNLAIINVIIGGNNFTSLDMSQNINLTHFYSSSCHQMTSVDLANGQNTNIAGFVVVDCPNLSCIKVDDVAYSTANWTNKGANTSFSLSCCTVNIPDANFKAYLVGNTSINTNADNEIQCEEASAFTGTINCQNMGISDLSGIEAFVSLTSLLCGNNDLTSLDVTQNTALLTLQCQSNDLSSIDLSQNTSLGNFVCVDNQLTDLDISQNTSLTLLSISDNELTDIDLSQNTNLTILVCSNNSIETLDVSNNTSLQNFNCTSNSLTELNMKNLSTTTLSGFDATSNPSLTCIEVDDVAAATSSWTQIDSVASFSLDCGNTLGVQSQNSADEIMLYPNPVKSELLLQTSQTISSLRVLDVSGKTVMVLTNSAQSIDVSTLSNGIYFLVVHSDAGTWSKKFIKE